MSDSARLERRYRRLLACYPRAFRRANEEEILAVLLACAQDGQRRPDFAASADLIKGAIHAWLWPAVWPPRPVRAAIRLMYASVPAQLAILITTIVTAGSVRSAVAHRYPGLAAAQQSVTVNLIIEYAGMPIGVAMSLLLIRALVRGRDRARAVLVALFAAQGLSMFLAIGRGAVVFAPADLIADGVLWAINLAAIVLLFTGASNRYYRPGPRSVTPWRGTFGTTM